MLLIKHAGPDLPEQRSGFDVKNRVFMLNKKEEHVPMLLLSSRDSGRYFFFAILCGTFISTGVVVILPEPSVADTVTVYVLPLPLPDLSARS